MKIYVIDDGVMFEGTIDQFRDCFFSNASERNVRKWCKKHKYKFEIKHVPKCEFCNEPITDPNEITHNKITGKASHRNCFFKKYPDSKPKI